MSHAPDGSGPVSDDRPKHAHHAAGDHGSADEHPHAGHSHALTRAGEVAGASDARLLWTVVFNQLLTVRQVVAGILSGSLALLSDAAHNFNDANALLIAYVARRISRRGANERYTFGYRRAELIGAMVNLTTLGVVGLYLVYEAVMRFFNPERSSPEPAAMRAQAATGTPDTGACEPPLTNAHAARYSGGEYQYEQERRPDQPAAVRRGTRAEARQPLEPH